MVASPMIFFTLYSRSYCHLCDEMREALVELMAGVPHRIDIVDIDLDPRLVSRYDELVPVLFASQVDQPLQPGRQLCHYFLDVDQVRAFCDQ